MKGVYALWVCLLLGGISNAQVITVDDDGSADHTTIQAAIDASGTGDIVVVCPGTYTGTGNYNINFGGMAITVRSTNPQDPAVVAATVIDCDYLGRGFDFNNSEGLNSIINGFTIVNAEDSSFEDVGGAIRCDGSSPTVANCRILNSIGYIGGGICNENGSSPTLINCVISGNDGGDSGGGLFNSNDSDPNVINCTFSGNSAWEGGAIFNDQSNPKVINCTITGNSAYDGGGIFSDYECISKVTNCTFSDNLATALGGSIFNNGNSNTRLSNCILWGNGPDEIYVNTGTVTVNYSDVQGGYSGTGNINEDPLFVDADGPDDVVGTEDDDLRLLSGSPCIDAGDSTAVGPDTADIDEDGGTTEQTPWDLDGNLRLLDDPDTTDTGTTEGAIPIVDMGAHESSGLAMIGDFEPDGDVDMDDLVVIVTRWLDISCGDCGGADLSGDGSVNLADFAKFAQTGLVGGGHSHKPIFAPIGNRYILEQQNLSFAVSATDPDGDDLTYSAFNMPDGAGFEPLTQVFDWTPTVGQAGKYFVTFYVSDGSLLDDQTIMITVDPNFFDSLVGNWAMDDNAGNTTVIDSSENGNHGIAQQNTSILHTEGVIDSALTFDGSSDYVDCGNSTDFDITDAVTISAWVKFDSLGISQGIVDKGIGPNDGVMRLWIFKGNDNVYFDAPQDIIRINGSPAGGFSIDTWYHIVATYDKDAGANNLNLYINGTNVATSTDTDAMGTNSANLIIGARKEGLDSFFDGLIDDVRIFNKALSESEVEDLYNEGGM